MTGYLPSGAVAWTVLALEVALLFTLAAALLELVATGVLLRRPKTAAGASRAATPSGDPPGITILKPLCGLDEGLAENLETFCRLDYPLYELIFCLQSRSDPAYAVAERVCRDNPQVECRLLVSSYEAGLNPKVNNLLAGYDSARHPLVLISDSNVSVKPGYLREAAGHFDDERVALISHLVRGTGARSLGASLENGHLNTYILGAVAGAALIFKQPLVIGKSMLLRKKDLDSLGGLWAVKDYLAEDYRLGRLLHGSGHRVVVSGATVDTRDSSRSLGDFVRRHIRWNRMRVSIGGPAYLLEVLGSPLVLALALALLGGGHLGPARLLAAALAGRLLLDAGMAVLLGGPFPWRQVAWSPLRDFLVAFVWLAAPLSRKICWRGNDLILASGSRLVDPRARRDLAGAPAVRLAED